MKKQSCVTAFLLLVFHIQVNAAENPNDPTSEMDRLITAGQFQQAFELGAANLDDFEGEARFDFFYGLAALESGFPNDAVFALERVAATATNSVLRDRARLELARAYFVTNNLTASENLFNRVLASNPPANVQQNIEAFLQLIEARRNAQSATFDWTIASQIGSDTNVNSATSNGLIDTPLIGEIELDPSGQETDDSYSNTLVTMTYKYPFNRNQSLDVSLNFNHLDNFDTDQFDIDSLRGDVAYKWGNDSNRYSHSFAYNKVNLDQNGFQESLALNTSWQHVGENGWYQTAAASYSQIRYDTSNGGALNALRDVNQVLLTGGLTKIIGPYTHSANLYHADESPEASAGEHNGRQFTGIAYSLLYRLNAQHTPYLRASVQKVKHDSEHPVFFDTVRKGQTESVTFGWFWQYQRNLIFTAQTSYTQNDSNIPLFDYSRFKYQAGFRVQF